MSAKIVRPDCFGKVKILFSDKISTKEIRFSDINSSNTDIRIIPYNDPSSGEHVNLTDYNFTWTTIKLTEYELDIQLNFTEPD